MYKIIMSVMFVLVLSTSANAGTIIFSTNYGSYREHTVVINGGYAYRGGDCRKTYYYSVPVVKYPQKRHYKQRHYIQHRRNNGHSPAALRAERFYAEQARRNGYRW